MIVFVIVIVIVSDYKIYMCWYIYRTTLKKVNAISAIKKSEEPTNPTDPTDPTNPTDPTKVLLINIHSASEATKLIEASHVFVLGVCIVWEWVII